MPRTKLKKTTTNKRNRNSTAEDATAAACAELERELEQGLDDFKLSHQQKWDQIRNHIKNIRSKLSDEVLSMTMNEMDDLLQNHAVKNYAQAQGFQSRHNNPLLNITNTTMNSILCNSVRKTSRTDDGDSARSDVSRSVRPMGPFQSAKAKSRNRSQSANTLSTNILTKASQIRQTPRESRSRFRTPQAQRIQTMSADRSIGPVTPKVQHGQKVAMLRYAKQGETVISLGGSPVVASSVITDRANINIPLAHGIFSIQPSAGGTVDPAMVSQFDRATIEQLRQLQDNLNLILDVASGR